ncbi:MAG: ParB/RepB/Spo0J family partition protein [Oscillospiraceae bacterium]|nr:ParB/RepB/Spo0J family partition protein [Oscillospiraceae bacterium]
MAMSRGLDALLGDNGTGDEVTTLRITQIEPSREQPRKSFDENKLGELAESIREHGLIQPIIVRTSADGLTYRIIAGERRFRACRMAGLREVPVIVRDADDEEIKKIALIENVQREDLDPVEEALAIKALLEGCDLTQEALAKTIGKSRSYIANSVRLLGLPEKVLEKLAQGEITTGHAKALLSLENGENAVPAMEEIIKRGLNVRQTEKMVELLNSGNEDDPRKEKPVSRPHYYEETELALKNALGRSVKIKSSGQKGIISFEFYGEEDLTAIANRLADALSEGQSV